MIRMGYTQANRVAAVLLMLSLVFTAAGAYSGNSQKLPLTTATMARDYARLTFEWPEMVYFTARAEGRTLSITFDREANPDFTKLLEQMKPYVTRAERKPDGKTIVLTLNKPYRIRTFVSDNLNGIDLLQADAGTRKKTVASAAAPAETKNSRLPMTAEQLSALAPAAGEEAVVKKEEESAPASSPVVPPTAVPAASVQEPAPAAAASTEQVASQPVAPKTEASAAEEKVVTPQNAVVQNAPQEAVAPVAAQPDAPKAVVPEAKMVVEGGSDREAAPADQIQVPEKSDGRLKISVSPSADDAVLRFPFTERTAMAVFVRTQTLWVVFNHQEELDLSDFDDLPRTVIGKPDVIKNTHATILRLPLQEGIYPSVAQESGSSNWAVLLNSKKRELATPFKVDINTDPPAPAHVFIPALEAADPVLVDDPQIGDTLIVAPLFNPGEGIAAKREFVEFSLLSTAQGVVVAKKSEDVQMSQLRNGLRVSTPDGSVLTPGLPSLSQNDTEKNQARDVVTLFPYATWKSLTPDFLLLQIRQLFSRLADVESASQDANSLRLRIAQYYLSEGMAPEAIMYLDGINRTNPAYYRSAKLNALRGSANFLMYRFAEAARDFSAKELNDNKEIEYWRSMISDLLGNPDQNYNFLAMNQDYISKYPPIFRQRLAIVAADRSIAAKEYNVALKIFDTLQEDKLLEPINQYVNFMLAKIASDNSQDKEANDIWDKLALDYKYPFVRARAEFSRITWGMDNGAISKEQAIDRLEKLRLSWHGDGLELQILTLLGDLYADRTDYVNAMRIWNGGVISFPNTAASVEMSRRMQEAFILMFNDGGADILPPLDALAIYYEYRNYTPSGSTGNAMIERLAERLLSMDLLDQAAVLLDHQMRFQMEKEQRSRLGAKLATVYLSNRQPQKALQVLQDSMYGENPLALRLQRNRLTAQAMAALGQSEKVLQTLGQDDSPEAEHIRLGVYWQQKDWARVITSVEAMLKTRKDATSPITLEESEYLLKLALAYVFKNDVTQLQYLHDYFSPLMANNPNQQIFEFITSGDIVLTTTNFDDVVQRLSDTRNFIDKYEARISEETNNSNAPAKATGAI